MPLHETCQLTQWNFISQDCYIVNSKYMLCQKLLYRCSCNKYACRPSVTATNMAAVQTCLLNKCCCKMGTCWTVATQSACLSSFCNSILHLCWRCASLADTPAGVVSHHQPCLLVWCFLIWLLCLICLPGVLWWLSGSSSRCHRVVCRLWLWYFLIILTYYFSLSTMPAYVSH